MGKLITIKKTKGIEHLEFHVPSNPGVYLLVGANGSGKTTVLTALHRLCNANALRYGFKASQKTRLVDSFKDARITYSTKGKSVTFAKREQKWAPTPKNNCSVLKDFGFSNSVFIKAADSRLSPREEEIKKGNIEPADDEVKNAMNMLFDTQRYDELQRLKSVYGRGRAYIHFYVMGDSKQGYYSEKCFSTGSLAMLRLVEQLRHVERGALILLDEAELALHPKVQLKLLQYLRSMAESKKLTIIVSTHSPAMIRDTPAKNILLLSSEPDSKGRLTVVTPCYPAYAMGYIDVLDNHAPDYIFCVEDDMAQIILREILHRFIETQNNSSHRNLRFNIIPVGGWIQTLEFVKNSRKMLFSNTCIRAVLDADVFELQKGDKMEDLQQKKKLLEDFKGIAYNLGVTPELAIVEALEKQVPSVMKFIREKFDTDLATFFRSQRYRSYTKAKPRDEAKEKLNLILAELCAHCALNQDVVLQLLVPALVDVMYTRNKLAEFAGKALSHSK